MSGSTRPRSAVWTIVGVVIAAITTAFGIYSWYEDKKSEDIVTIQGFLVDENDRPLSVDKIWLTQNLGKSFDGGNTQGVFSIPNVRLHDNNKLGLIFQFKDSTTQELIVDIPNPRYIDNGIMSLGRIKIAHIIPLSDPIPAPIPVHAPDSIILDQPKVIKVSYRACVDTKSDPLVLRDSPGGDRIGHIGRKECVNVIQAIGEVDEISGRIGKWCKITHKGRVGFVFSGYLKPNYPEEIY